MMACIGEPISWPRLEAFALGAPDPAIPLHTAACPACRHCLEHIRGDTVALRPLGQTRGDDVELLPLDQTRGGDIAPVFDGAEQRRPARAWWRAPRWWEARRRSRARRSAQPGQRWWPAVALAAAALVAIAVLAPVISPSSPPGSAPLGVVAVKGIGDVRLELVRERAGEIRRDASTFARGDRWKVIVTCAPRTSTWVEVSVSDGATSDHPIAPAQLACGNRVVVPGAFAITGIGANRVCVRIAASPGAPAASACTTLRPE
ncbi:MAG TPA: hypothetical protein VGD80_31865 [Kofleriaceae bacterium]